MKKYRIFTSALGISVLFVAFLAALSARAELIAYDQFIGYTDGQIGGQGQGFGWAGGWVGSTNFTVASTGNLSHVSLEDAGGGASIGTETDLLWWQIKRTLAVPITNTGTYYFSFLLQPSKSGSSYSRHTGIRMDDASGFFRVGGGIWDNLGQWALRRRNNGNDYGNVQTGISKATNITHFVIKFVFDTGGNESADMYVNPADAAALAGAGDANYTFSQQWPDISTITVVRYQQSGQLGNMAFDEIRLGTEAADMFAPIPPSPGTIFIFE